MPLETWLCSTGCDYAALVVVQYGNSISTAFPALRADDSPYPCNNRKPSHVGQIDRDLDI